MGQEPLSRITDRQDMLLGRPGKQLSVEIERPSNTRIADVQSLQTGDVLWDEGRQKTVTSVTPFKGSLWKVTFSEGNPLITQGTSHVEVIIPNHAVSGTSSEETRENN